jgi:hypothetical protein
MRVEARKHLVGRKSLGPLAATLEETDLGLNSVEEKKLNAY